MKSSILSSIALLPFALCTANLHADTFDLALTTDSSVDIPVEAVSINDANAHVFTYTASDSCVVGIGGCLSVLSNTTSVFTATYTAVSPNLALLNVNDVCTKVALIGNAPGCQDFAFSLTDVTLGDGQLGVGAIVNALALADINVGVGLTDLNINGGTDGPQLIAAGVNGGNYEVQFTAATPEPGSLSLMATGLAATAGIVRRRLGRPTA